MERLAAASLTKTEREDADQPVEEDRVQGGRPDSEEEDIGTTTSKKKRRCYVDGE